MSHVRTSNIHCHRDRARYLRFDITTATSPSDITFKAGPIEQTGLSSVAISGGLRIDVDLTSTELDITEGGYDWELRFTVSGEPHPAALGRLTVSAEPTDDD